jgi:hypothetical protein
MRKRPVRFIAVCVLTIGLSALEYVAHCARQDSQATLRAASEGAAELSVDSQNQLVSQYCVTCHSDKAKAGGLSLARFDAAVVDKNPEVAEEMIRKLRAGLMPPPGAPKPSAAMITSFVVALENKLDAAAALNSDPGWRPFQRLNRAEYARVVRDLLALEVDVTAFLPPDTQSNGFDNVADVQSFSPTLIAGYLRAAGQISRLAVSNKGVSATAETPSRKKVFICRPLKPQQEETCAMRIIKNLAAQAYRGAATNADIQDALAFYKRGRQAGDFDNGIRLALQSMLVSPRFLFRLEGAKPAHAYRLSPQEIATRLSFFLWATGPDAELLKAATSGAFNTPAGLEKQVRRMFADPRSEALATRFASQWLRLQDLDKLTPDATRYPQYNRTLAQAMLRETELFFDSFVREDRNVMDLFTVDYSFVNERLARHYGIPNVTGDAFRRVQMPEYRRGLFGQGSILASTSVADRTSPVLRGKWIMEVLLGTPPPPPPPNVPALDDSVKSNQGGKSLSTRQRIEQHRRIPSCNACHRFIDPPGLALENFDVTGAWRETDNGVPIDATTDLYDGTKMNGPVGLRQAMLNHQDMVLRNFAENLLTYAIGRRVEYSDMPAVRAITNNAAKQSNRFSAFVLGVVNSAAFQMAKPRSAPNGTGAAPASSR